MNLAVTSRKNNALRLLWLAELAIVGLTVLAAARLFVLYGHGGHVALAHTGPVKALVVAAFLTASMAAFGLYQPHIRLTKPDFALRLVLSFAFGGAGLLILYRLVPLTYINLGVLVLSLFLGAVGITLARAVSLRVLGADSFKRRVLVMGAGSKASLINQRLRRRADRHSFTLVGFLPATNEPVQVADELCIHTSEPLPALASRLNIEEIVVAVDDCRDHLPMDDMLACSQRGMVVSHLSSFLEREAGMIRMEVSDTSSLVFSGGFNHSVFRRLNKRLFDLLAASSLLLLAWPAMLLVAAGIWLESGSPVFYRQVRVGMGGELFELVKFRSMRVDAEGDGVARWAQRDDDRSTRLGRFIRMTRLDELPQLFNVLRGEMSFVGPRPERPQFVELLTREIRCYDVRHCMKPGLTGWAQMRYPYGASVEDAAEKLAFDLFYVKNHGLMFDLMILLQTVEVVLFRRGGR